jgi:hypothetical protein
MSVEVRELESRLQPIRQKLFDARSARPRPLTDKKILAACNGMIIRGLADAGRNFDNQDYLVAAFEAAEFVLDKLVTPDGRLLRTHTQGTSKLNAYLDDYANVIDGLLALHRATGDARWLERAERLQRKQDELFWDKDGGGYFFTSHDHEELLARGKPIADSAIPSGNSVAAGNLVYLGRALGKPEYEQRAEQTILAASGYLEQYPTIAPRMLIAVRALLNRQADNK